MKKYPILKELFPFNSFVPPISKSFLKFASHFMTAPSFIWKNKNVTTKKIFIQSYDNYNVECYIFSPVNKTQNSPCIMYFHGGGFVLKASTHHYKYAMDYAEQTSSVVVFVNYRLSPQVQHPVFFEDCYSSFCWTYDHATELGIDINKIGVAGDSAGATLAVGVTMMAKDRNHPVKFLFQMLLYPFLDARGNSTSNQKYTDTPMWNSTLSKKISKYTKIDTSNENYKYYSPVEACDFSYLPPAYIETAEFDCLHDDGILYSKLLQNENIKVVLNETKGTIHGYDTVVKAQVSKNSVKQRIEFIKTFI